MARHRDPTLEKMIDEVSVVCDSEAGVAMGLCYAMQEHLEFPFWGRGVGEEVVVEGVMKGEEAEVVALCRLKGRVYRVRLDDITISRRPNGAEWIDAYFQFRGKV